MLLNFEDTLLSTMTESEEIEHILGILMDQQYSLKTVLKYFR